MLEILSIFLLYGMRLTYASVDKHSNAVNSVNDGEYCLLETFNPSCPSGEILLIQSAKYGRMNIGKCIKEEELNFGGSSSSDPKFFGCQAEVTNILHKKCSFHKDCSVEVKDSELLETNPCYSWAKSHLKVLYKCLKVVQNEDITSCRVVLSDKATHLIVDNSEETRCGSSNSPWIFEVYKGKTIKISHLSFSSKSDNRPLVCSSVAAVVVDRRAKSNVTLCEQRSDGKTTTNTVLQETREFRSQSSIVEIFKLPTTGTVGGEPSLIRLILKIEADGCLDIIPPEDTWLKRNNDDIVIGCYASKQTWYLRCEHGRWSGTLGNCSTQNGNILGSVKEPGGSVGSVGVKTMSQENQILVIIAIGAFGIVTCLLIICCGLIVVKKFKNHSNPKALMAESYYGGKHVATYHGAPYSYATASKTLATPDDKKEIMDSDEQKYFVLDENLVK